MLTPSFNSNCKFTGNKTYFPIKETYKQVNLDSNETNLMINE